MIRKFGLKTVTTAAVAASVGSAMFGGAALATGGHHNHSDTDEGGDGGKGGKTVSQCLIPIGLSLGALAGTGGDVSQCNAYGGEGGAGGTGEDTRY